MLLSRICKNCGCTFEGGPRASYCPECRKGRYKEYNKKYFMRKKQKERIQQSRLFSLFFR